MEVHWNDKYFIINAYHEDDPQSFGRLINHCIKHTNVEPYFIIYNEEPIVIFRALKNIEPGEQLFFNYGNKYFKSALFLDCPCD